MKVIHDVRLSFIEEKILKHLSNIMEREMPEVSKLIVFGSRVRGNSGESSDLDIAVIVSTHIDKKLWDRLWEIKWRVLESLQSEEFPLFLIPITMNDLLSKNFGLERSIKTEGTVWWKRES